MMNTTLKISLPETLTHYISQRVAEEHFSNVSDYIRALIFAEQQQRDEQQLEQLLLEGLNSEPALISDSAEWQSFWEKLQLKTQKCV
jgi:antitoxin ParD1/3/4